MFNLIQRIASLVIRLATARSRVLLGGIQMWAANWVRSLQFNLAALVSAVLAGLTGYSAVLLWIRPELRPAMLAVTAVMLSLLAWGLHRYARSIQCPPKSLQDALNELRTDIGTIRSGFGDGRAEVGRNGESPHSSTDR